MNFTKYTEKKTFLTISAVVVIMIAAFGVRFYNFHDWLYFKMDQSRDASMINNAVKNGAENLPLLGPRAGATQVSNGYLRLGPAYYYFQYLSGKIFNSTHPETLAYPDLFFSIAVLPLLFLFLRLYFSRKHALLILTMYAFSFLIIQYSRFAWNPNPLPFFMILSFYGLLRFSNDDRLKWRLLWIALWAGGMSIGSQLHFFGFFTLVGLSGLFFLIHYKVWKKEELLGLFKTDCLKRFAMFAGVVVLVFGLIYTPVIISDSMRKWENSRNFIEALSTKAEKKPFLEKIQKDFNENAKYYCILTTADCYDAKSLNTGKPLAALSVIILLAGIGLAIRGIRKRADGIEKDFLYLFLVWFATFSILTIPVAFQLRPRFFIVVFALPFIALGLIYQFLEEKFSKKGMILSFLITAVVLGLNIRGTAAWFKEQSKSQKSDFAVRRTLILKAKDGVTLGQLQGAVDFMFARHRSGATLYYYVKPEHVMPVRYLLYQKQPVNFNYSPLKVNGDPNAEFFAITPVGGGINPLQKKYPENEFTILSSQQVGQLMVYELAVANRVESKTFRFNRDKKNSDRIFWRDVFNIKKANSDSLEISGDE